MFLLNCHPGLHFQHDVRHVWICVHHEGEVVHVRRCHVLCAPGRRAEYVDADEGHLSWQTSWL